MSGDGGDRTPLIKTPLDQDIEDKFVETGYGEVIRKAKAYHEIDTSAIRDLGKNVFGTSEIVNEHIASVLDPKVEDTGKTIGESLATLALSARKRVDEEVDAYWQGPAFDAFDDYSKKLLDVTRLEALRHGFIGDELVAIAECVEREQAETEDAWLKAVEFALFAAGLWGPTAVTGLLAVGTLIESNVASAEEEMDRREKKIKELQGASVDLRSPKVRAIDPNTMMPPFPEDLEGWQVK